jgi:hypothetical protein
MITILGKLDQNIEVEVTFRYRDQSLEDASHL